MKLSTKIITAVMLIAGSSGSVYAFGKHGGWGMSPDEKVEFVTYRVAKKLNLDSEQQQNFSQLAQSVTHLMIDARATRAERFSEIDTMLQDPSFNQARALELVQQKTQMLNEKAPLVISSLAIFLDSLSPDQKQELRSLLEQRRKHHRRHGDSE